MTVTMILRHGWLDWEAVVYKAGRGEIGTERRVRAITKKRVEAKAAKL